MGLIDLIHQVLVSDRLFKMHYSLCVFVVLAIVQVACSSTQKPEDVVQTRPYVIGPGDSLQVFVWRNPDLSQSVNVRPDGKISTPLVEDMVAVGKTPTQLARDIETTLSEYIRTPKVNVIVTKFVGQFNQQIRVVGKAVNPKALAYRKNITVLDVMIEVGGLSDTASGNRAKIVRQSGNEKQEIKVRLGDLLYKGDMNQNLVLRPMFLV